MESVYAELTSRARNLRDKCCNADHTSLRCVIAVSGPPGSGKSTIAAEVVRRLNQTSVNGRATVLPMDGFHLSQATLKAMPNSEEAVARRGVHWTFDAQGVLELVSALHRTRGDRSVIHLAPSFDHAIKDPTAEAIKISPEVDLVIIEGNWLLFDEAPWSSIAKLVDDTWFVDVDEKLALERVAKRHLESGIEKSWEQAVHRARTNDMVNGDLVRTKLVPPNVRVQSINDGTRKH